MSIADIPVFGVLRGTMHMLTSRQKVLAENIANADTPGYTPRDVDEKSFQKAMAEVQSQGKPAMRMFTTEGEGAQYSAPGQLASTTAGVPNMPPVKIVSTPGYEKTINGNSVVLEEQVAHLSDTRMRYDAAVGLYQKSLGLIRLALKAPGK